MGRHVPFYSPITFGRMGLKSGAQLPTDGSAAAMALTMADLDRPLPIVRMRIGDRASPDGGPQARVLR